MEYIFVNCEFVYILLTVKKSIIEQYDILSYDRKWWKIFLISIRNIFLDEVTRRAGFAKMVRMRFLFRRRNQQKNSYGAEFKL